MKAWAIAAALTALIGSGTAMADTTGKTLITDCQAAVQVLDHGAAQTPASASCQASVRTVVEMVALMGKNVPKDMTLCLPDTGADEAQQVHIVTKYLQDNPRELSSPATLLVSFALTDAFGCK